MWAHTLHKLPLNGLSASMSFTGDLAEQEFVAIAGAEAQRQAEPDPEKRKYPGGAFDPLGLSKDSKVRPCPDNLWGPLWILCLSICATKSGTCSLSSATQPGSCKCCYPASQC